MNDKLNYAEACVKKKKDAKIRSLKAILTTCYIVVPIAAIILTFAVPILRPFFMLPLALTPIALAAVIPHTWCYTEIEFESILATGILTVSYVYNRRKRKKIVEIKVGEASAIVPYNDEYKATVDAKTDAVLYDARSSADARGIYAILFQTADGKDAKLLFEPSDKMIGILRFFNRETVVTKVGK